MKRSFFAFLLVATFLYCAIPSHSQQLPPVRLVDMPTAGTLPSKTLLLESNLYDGGGLVQTFTYGISGLINIGCSYGGTGVIGAGRVTWQPHVALQARIRLIEESLHAPALAIGFDSQGFGPYAREGGNNRFRTKSRGAYVAVSRNYRMLGDFGLHGGANYSLETDDGDEDPSFWFGLDKSIGNQVEIACEYDFATNDNEDSSMTANRGYLNGVVRWRFGNGFAIELDVRNILRNAKKDVTGFLNERPEPSRELRFTYRWGL